MPCKSGTLSTIRRNLLSLPHKSRRVAEWRSILVDPSLAATLRHGDDNIAELQSMLQEFSNSGKETFTSIINLLTAKVCVTGSDKILFSYIRTLLEVFSLYSITTSDFIWICDGRATYIGRQTEIMSDIAFAITQFPAHVDVGLSQDYLQLAALQEKISRREQCRSEIIKTVIDLTNTIPENIPFKTFNHGNHFHQVNSMALLRRLKPTGYYWIAMAYCLAIENVFFEPPPIYIEG